MNKKTKKTTEKNQVVYDLLIIIYIIIFIIVFTIFGFENYYRKLMLPIGFVFISQIVVYNYYTKRYKKRILPNLVSFLTIFIVYLIFFKYYDKDVLKSVSLPAFFVYCGLASFCSIIVTHYTLEFLFNKKLAKRKKMSESDLILDKAKKNVRR